MSKSRKIQLSEPDPTGLERAEAALARRNREAELSHRRPRAVTRANGEESDYGDKYPANFTKGLYHDDDGLLANGEDYVKFVEAINSADPTLFDNSVETAESRAVGGNPFHCQPKSDTQWRGWESPRAGHAFDLEGPDAGAVGMAPAPRVGSCELAREMAEVYGMALLRDESFADISAGKSPKIKGVLRDLGKITCAKADGDEEKAGQCGCNPWLIRPHPGFGADAFRGSTKGALRGPYISQFLLIGNASRAGNFALEDGIIEYGTQKIDQRVLVHEEGLDYMTDWCSWRDVQNGADFREADQFEEKRRFITTPRDLATYVHFDQLYQAYLNAALILLGMEVPTSKGFPEPSRTGRRDKFATFGPPHILTLVTEVATRCLKVVRRQKFNHHRRARPEAIGGRLVLAKLGCDALGCSKDEFEATLRKIPESLLCKITEHNEKQNLLDDKREIQCGRGKAACKPPCKASADKFNKANILLPMAFPEGSPMHPSYGAGHATVAGGCVTMLKAFFEMFEDCNSFAERELREAGGKYCKNGGIIRYQPNNDKASRGTKLESGPSIMEALKIQGELDKLAANISIGRNMAGVHYYSDYYDSIRMGERVAVGILMEQASDYNDSTEVTFKSFDGDILVISCQNGGSAELTVLDSSGRPVRPSEWWLRHTG